jgi:hypothetical protein
VLERRALKVRPTRLNGCGGHGNVFEDKRGSGPSDMSTLAPIG